MAQDFGYTGVLGKQAHSRLRNCFSSASVESKDQSGSGIIEFSLLSILNKLGMPESEIHELFNAMDIEILAYEKVTAIATGGIRSITQKKGLSLGDRACLATAKQHKRIALTADKAWLEFQDDIEVEIKLIR